MTIVIVLALTVYTSTERTAISLQLLLLLESASCITMVTSAIVAECLYRATKRRTKLSTFFFVIYFVLQTL